MFENPVVANLYCYFSQRIMTFVLQQAFAFHGTTTPESYCCIFSDGTVLDDISTLKYRKRFAAIYTVMKSSQPDPESIPQMNLTKLPFLYSA